MSANEIRAKIMRQLREEFPEAEIKVVTKARQQLVPKRLSKLAAVQTDLGIEPKLPARAGESAQVHVASVKTVAITEDGKKLPQFQEMTFDAEGKMIRAVHSK